MKYYRVIGTFYNHDFITSDGINKKEFKKWFRKNYSTRLFIKVKEIDVSELDPIWAMHLKKENGQIKFA